MRIGENPTKYSRKSSGRASIPIKVPLPITVCTVTYVPNLEGYYKEGLDVLKLNIFALRDNTAEEFDLMVFDNGSCEEVVNWLVKLKEENIIQWLFLSSENMKKLGAWNLLFSASQGDLVYYFDSDIYHYDGWLEGLKKTLLLISEAGIVGGFHNIPTVNLGNNINIVRQHPDYILEKGRYIDNNMLKELAVSLGTDVENFVNKKQSVLIHKITLGNESAYLGTSHCQFLAKRECLKDIFPTSRDWALKYTDKEFDRLLDQKGWLRLTTTTQYVYHIGNRVVGKWREKLERVDYTNIKTNRTGEKELSPFVRFIVSLPPTRKLIIFLYNILFNLLYRVR